MIRLGSPTWTAFIRRQQVLSPHCGCHHSFPNFMRDGNSIKVRSGHKPHKLPREAHMLEVRYFQHPWPHYLGSLRNIQHKHECWTSQIVLIGEKACKQHSFYSLRAGDKARIAYLNCIHKTTAKSLVSTVDATTPLQTVWGMATQSKWEVDTILIYHSKFIGKHMHWSSVLSPHGGCYYCQTFCKMFASKWVESNNLQERV